MAFLRIHADNTCPQRGSTGVLRTIGGRPTGIAQTIGGIVKCDQLAIIEIMGAWNTNGFHE